MENLIERYIYDVVRRLPEKDRGEIGNELRANIYDMLQENPSDTEVEAVLISLGAPALLADKFRHKPRYLISPAFYDDYINSLKHILPLVGGLVFSFVIIGGLFDALKNSITSVAEVFQHVLPKAISSTIYGVFSALFWITVGYIIAERVGKGSTSSSPKEWTVNDLPKTTHSNKNAIKLFDTIAELVMIVVFYFIGILLITNNVQIIFLSQSSNTEAISMLNDDFIKVFIPIFTLMTILYVFDCVCKIIKRAWTPFICFVSVAVNILTVCAMIFLINQPAIFSTPFIELLTNLDLEILDMSSIGISSVNAVPIMIFAGVVIVTVIEICIAIYKTFVSRKKV